MADDLPSPTPEKSGNDKAAANTPSNKRGGKPEQKLNPTQVESGQETPLWLRVLEGGGFIGALVIWAEMSQCHAALPLAFYLIALLGCYVGICHLVHQFLKDKCEWSAKISVFLWFGLAVITAAFVYENSQPPPQKLALASPVSGQNPKVGIKLRLSTSQSGPEMVPLTNDFLFSSASDTDGKDIRGLVVIPMSPGSSNIALQFWALNKLDSDIPIRGLTLGLSNLEHTNLLQVVDASGWGSGKGELGNPIWIYHFRSPELLPGDGEALPALVVAPRIDEIKKTSIASPVYLTFRAEQMPSVNMTFGLAFVVAPLHSNPVVVLVKSPRDAGTNSFFFDLPK